MTDWTYKGEPFTETPDKKLFIGFVYLITDPDGRKYIGKKIFWSRKTRQVKGKKKRYLGESDWRKYYGSNEELKCYITENTSVGFVREILHLCRSKSECSYIEIKEQVNRDVLLRESYYNKWITCKITKKHLAKFCLHEDENSV